MNGVRRGPRFFLRKWRNRTLSLNNIQQWQQASSQRQSMAAFKQIASASSAHPQNSLLSALLHSFSIHRSTPSPPAYLFLVNTLLQRSLLHQIPPVLRLLRQSHPSFRPPELIFSALISAYGSAGFVQEALDLFFAIPDFRCVPSAISLDAVLSLLCRDPETIDAVPAVLLKSHRLLKIRLEESSFRILISALCRIRKHAYGMELLNSMISSGYDLDGKICSTILESLCGDDGSSDEEIVRFFNGVKKLGFLPGRNDYLGVIRALVRRGRGNGAATVLTEMKCSSIKPDTDCYNLVLEGAVEEENYAYAEQLFDEMLVLGLVPDIHTFNFFIRGQCRQRRIDEGMKILSAMDELGCRPNLYTYTLLLELLCEMGEFDGAEGLMKEAESKGISPDSETYGRMIRGLIRVGGDLPRACSLLEEMMQNHHDPLPYTVDDMICGLCEKGCVSEAIFWLNRLISCTTYPDSSTWTLLLKNTRFSDLGSEPVMSLLD